jgi:hypothetical protein
MGSTQFHLKKRKSYFMINILYIYIYIYMLRIINILSYYLKVLNDVWIKCNKTKTIHLSAVSEELIPNPKSVC